MREHNPNMYSVVQKDGWQTLVDTEGKEVPCLMMTRVTDDAENERAVVLVKMLVNIGYAEQPIVYPELTEEEKQEIRKRFDDA